MDDKPFNDLQNQAAAIIEASSDERDLVNQILGQAQMAEAFGKFSQTVWASKLSYIKENKLYRAIAGKKTPNGLELKGTWVEFCGLLGVSDEKANQDIANLKSFGEEALESMSKMGIGYREMRQYRKLPDDQKQALIEVASTGDKDNFIELAEEIISKHSKEKEQLTSERDEAVADSEATRQVSAQKDEKINHLSTELEKSRRRISTSEPDQVAKELQIEAAGIAAEFKSIIQTKLRPAVEALMDYQTLHPEIDQQNWLSATISDLQLDLTNLADDYQLDELAQGQLPDFLDPDKVAAANAKVGAMRDERGI
jgi:hypothetical protein